MSRSRRNFSAEFKTNLVLQLLKGEKELNVLAVENDIQPNLLRNWKKEKGKHFRNTSSVCPFFALPFISLLNFCIKKAPCLFCKVLANLYQSLTLII